MTEYQTKKLRSTVDPTGRVSYALLNRKVRKPTKAEKAYDRYLKRTYKKLEQK